MKDRPLIGFYAHSHGSGHVHRCKAIAAALEGDYQIFSSGFQDDDLIAHKNLTPLPNENLPDDLKPYHNKINPTPNFLHYAPAGVSSIRERTAILANWFAEKSPDLMFVDVSVEIALLCRVCSVPFVFVRMHGHRTDDAHLAAYESARLLAAPFPEWMEQAETPDWVREKTFYAGGLCRFDKDDFAVASPKKGKVVIINGSGGTGFHRELAVQWAEDNSQLNFHLLGKQDFEPSLPSNLRQVGQLGNPLHFLADAEVVIASCGDNMVAELSLLKKNWICVPEERPFDEQHQKAQMIAKANAAVVAESWRELRDLRPFLDKARQTDKTKLAELVNKNAARDIALRLEQLALETRPHSLQNLHIATA